MPERNRPLRPLRSSWFPPSPYLSVLLESSELVSCRRADSGVAKSRVLHYPRPLSNDGGLAVYGLSETREAEMELMQLEMLVAVAEEHSFLRAAERVFRTQPAVSIGIRKLEDRFGVLLLD